MLLLKLKQRKLKLTSMISRLTFVSTSIPRTVVSAFTKRTTRVNALYGWTAIRKPLWDGHQRNYEPNCVTVPPHSKHLCSNGAGTAMIKDGSGENDHDAIHNNA